MVELADELHGYGEGGGQTVLVLTEVLWEVKGHAVIWNRAVTAKLNACLRWTS